MSLTKLSKIFMAKDYFCMFNIHLLSRKKMIHYSGFIFVVIRNTVWVISAHGTAM